MSLISSFTNGTIPNFFYSLNTTSCGSKDTAKSVISLSLIFDAKYISNTWLRLYCKSLLNIMKRGTFVFLYTTSSKGPTE